MNRRFTAAAIGALLLTAASAAAQDGPTPTSPLPAPTGVTLTPANARRWDAAVQVGWLGRNKSEIAPNWNDWYDAASFAASGGYYWTPNLKIELEAITTTTGSVRVDERVPVPGETFPHFRSRDHRFRATTLAGAVVYQFFENRPFHPFAAIGLAATYETERAVDNHGFSYRDPRVPLPPADPVRRASTTVHPFVTLGFKAYVTERTFLRSELQTAFSSDRAETIIWRGGVGVDF